MRSRRQRNQGTAHMVLLGPDELQAVFSFLDSDEDRRSALAVCKAWHAAFAADPSLWPAIVLKGPQYLNIGEVEAVKWAPMAALWRDSAERAELLTEAAGVSRRAQRVLLRKCSSLPDLVLACLAVLPSSVSELELDTACAGPLPAALQRFTALRTLRITGDAYRVDWASAGSARATPAVLSALAALHMVCAEPQQHDFDHGMTAKAVPRGLPQLLAEHATRLESLDVGAKWSEGVARLCRSLPALHTLRLGVFWSHYRHGGEEAPWPAHSAVALIRELSQVGVSHAAQLRSVTLSLDSGAGPEDGWGGWEEEEWMEGEAVPAPPAMAGIANLRGLEVRRKALLPPDWQSLSALRNLTICNRQADWGSANSLTKLSCLTQLTVASSALPRGASLPAAVCRLPALRSLKVVGSGIVGRSEVELPKSFTKLTQLSELVHTSIPLSDAATALLQTRMPGVAVVHQRWLFD